MDTWASLRDPEVLVVVAATVVVLVVGWIARGFFGRIGSNLADYLPLPLASRRSPDSEETDSEETEPGISGLDLLKALGIFLVLGAVIPATIRTVDVPHVYTAFYFLYGILGAVNLFLLLQPMLMGARPVGGLRFLLYAVYLSTCIWMISLAVESREWRRQSLTVAGAGEVAALVPLHRSVDPECWTRLDHRFDLGV